MTLEQMLQLEPSRRNIDQIINLVRDNDKGMNDLWNIFLLNKNPESRRAAWAIDLINEERHILKEYQIAEIIELLPTFKHQGMRRHCLRMLEDYSFNEDETGILTDICFKWLESSQSAVAVKMFCIKILVKIAENEPIIARELIDIIELQLDDSTSGFKSIASKSIRLLQKRMVKKVKESKMN